VSRPAGDAPLAGVRVLDLTHVLAGPFCTMVLAELGAEVIKVEAPGSPDYTRSIAPFAGDVSHYFLSVNRGKRSLAMDLKTGPGRRLARELALRSDVVVENFRPGVLKRLGLDFKTLSQDNPAAIVCSVSGFGQQGPQSQKGSVDIVVQALSGAMSLTGEADGPAQKLGLPMGDLAGAMWAVIGILAALRHRDATGQGSHVDVSLLDSLMSLLSYVNQMYLVTGQTPTRAGSRHHSVPAFGRYRVSDGEIVLSAQMDSLWGRFCQAAERPDLGDDPRFRTVADRRAHFDEVEEVVTQILSARPLAEWMRRLEAAGVPSGPILSVSEALEGEHAQARRLTRAIEQPGAGQVRVFGRALNFLAGIEEPECGPAPRLGGDSRAVLKEVLGLGDDEVSGLVSQGAVMEASEPRT